MEGAAKTVCDTVPQKSQIGLVERPRLLSRVGELGFKYNDLFGRITALSDSIPDILKDLPPLKGLKYRTYTISCKKDSCITSRSIIAVRCPKDSVLLRWVCKSIEEWDTLSRGSLSDQESLRSAGEIVTFYIKKLFKNNSSFFLCGLSGHFHLCHRSRNYCYAPSSKAETVSKIPHNKMREPFLNSF